MLHNFLSRPLSFLGLTTAMLFWLDFHQTQSNLYKWFRMHPVVPPGLQQVHVTPLFISLHWLPGAACIQFKTLMLAYRTTTGSAPTYYESTSPPEVWDLLVSDASWYHHREAQNHSPEHYRSPFLAGEMIFPSGTLDPCQSSSNNWKLIFFNTIWKKQNKKYYFAFFYIFIFISFSFPC